MNSEKIYKTPVYTRNAYKRYYDKNKDNAEFREKKKFYNQNYILKKKIEKLNMAQAQEKTNEIVEEVKVPKVNKKVTLTQAKKINAFFI